MKKAVPPLLLALLVASPALARTHQHRHHQTNPGAYGYVNRAPAAPTYGNDLPFAPF